MEPKHLTETTELARLSRLSQLLDSENGQRMKSGASVSPEYPYPFSPKRLATYQAELAQLPVESTCPECGGTGYG